MTSGRAWHDWPSPTPATGIIGLPSAATATKGKAVMDTLVTSFADHLDILGG